jgi:predicted regulator of Ras-like GTPase activity (Roadblock/LC7/MglB family)
MVTGDMKREASLFNPPYIELRGKRGGANLFISIYPEDDLQVRWHKMLKQILGEFLNLEGVSAAVVIGRDGFVIESAVSGKMDIDALGAMASTGIGTSEAMGRELGKGQLTQMLVELDKGAIIISPLSKDELIAIVGENVSNLGRIRYELKKNKERLVAAL